LVFGAFALAVNLGITDLREWWNYWPGLLLAMGLLQMIWPGTVRERLSGLWLVAVGIYGFVSVFEMFGLHYGTAWPILLVATGLRIVLGGLFHEDSPGPQNTGPQNPGPQNSGDPSGQGGVS
jgi:hypothetical protein